jgi:hypothetical protein
MAQSESRQSSASSDSDKAKNAKLARMGQIVSAAGTVFGLIGTYKAAQTQIEGFYNRAELSDIAAGEAQQAGVYAASQIALEGRRLRARQLVQYAKSGVMPDGTPNLVMAETKSEVERDAAFAMDQGARQASNMRLEAISNRRMAAAAKMQAFWQMTGDITESVGKMLAAG